MAKKTILNQAFGGVDMHTNPLLLSEGKVAEAVNLTFQEGTIRTRPGIRHISLGYSGQVQGATVYSPARGLSYKPFSDPKTLLVTSINGQVYKNLFSCGDIAPPIKVCGKKYPKCGEVNIYQAENYLIFQSQIADTSWWSGAGCYICSPGIGACEEEVEEACSESNTVVETLAGAQTDCCFEPIEVCHEVPVIPDEKPHSPHDTFQFELHRNFLINTAGLGIYAHGRIHQQGPCQIYVSDIIHKRGHLVPDDILLMEEQVEASFAPPLSTNSKMGQLRALEVLPQMGTANGQGELVAYYDRGVVTYNTALPARETQHDADGQKTRDGWDTKRQVTHVLNHVSAVGRYAVHAIPRDHVFRSKFGIHFLQSVAGEGTFKDEFISSMSQDVQPILDFDSKHMLRGTTISQWEENHRILCSVGFDEDDLYSPNPVGKGLVVWNQANTYTEDRTPRSMWEGLWLMDSEMVGFHRLLNVDESVDANSFGSLTSSYGDAEVFFSKFEKDLRFDYRNGEEVPIEWRITSKREFITRLSELKEVNGGRLELILSPGSQVRVSVKTDETECWEEWSCYETESDENCIVNVDLGEPDDSFKEASWFQFRIEGIGYAEIIDFEIEYSSRQGKLNAEIPCKEHRTCKQDFYEFSDEPSEKRWT